MVQQKPTPEEQLLKLIEGQGGQGAAPEAGKKPARKSFNPFAGLGKISGMFEYWKSSFQKKGQSGGGGAAVALEAALDIKWVNRALIVMVMVTMAYLVFDLAFFKPGRKDFLSQVAVSEPVFSPMNGLNAQAKDPSFYLDAVKRRNIFLPAGSGSPVAEEEAGVSTTGGSNIINEMLQGYKLVGISWGEEPLAMLEESATGRTYFLKKGQEFKGIKVQEIGKERVKLTFEGQEAELF